MPNDQPKTSQIDGLSKSESSVATLHLDAAFYHESAAFHHRQAALYLESGQSSTAERHVWAAFGHSLNAHQATREGMEQIKDRGKPFHKDGQNGQDGSINFRTDGQSSQPA